MAASYGAALHRDSDGAGTYTAVAKVSDITGPSISITDVDDSYLAVANGAKLFVPGMLDGGEVSATLKFDKAEVDTLEGLFRTPYYWKVVFPLASGESTPSQWAFQGHINGIGTSIPEDDAITFTVSIKVSGLPVWTSGS